MPVVAERPGPGALGASSGAPSAGELDAGADSGLRPVVLVGMTAVGKSTAAAALAERWGWDHADVDAEVEAATGRSIAELWHELGEAGFRACERDAVAAELGRGGRRVVSLGGGAVLDAATRELLRGGARVVWLRATPETLVARLGAEPGQAASRPVLGADPERRLRELDAERRPLYDAVADVVVDVDGLAPADVAAAVERALASVGRTAP
jgi:shikimate kinase